MGDYLQALGRSLRLAAVEHVLRRVDSLDIESPPDEFEERPIVAAAELQRRHTGFPDKRQVTRCVEGGAAQGGIDVRHDSGVEGGGAHGRNLAMARGLAQQGSERVPS